MIKNVSIAVLVIAAGAAIWWFFDAKSSEKSASPPLTGWMQNFTPTDGAPPTPPLAVRAESGRSVPLTEFSGKVTLVNFWATWCGPCIREMPSLLRLQKARGGSDFTVIALSQDLRGWPMVKPFLKKHGLAGLPIYVDEKAAVSRVMRIKGLPTSILLDRNGNELGRLAGHAEWDSAEALALIDHYVQLGEQR
ncbi:MAG: TlpA family protein disulfide reductase [Rhodospirillaceae bacterium]|jgi:thiol-disulfide isomerase/thioredoxin|nr:TlpA family protein disulfide reductase [Rhodospirillaceae bacterium]MBT5459503.1 TlpA family protein disulfide reductase [Rhodospirillaceae bacterium]